MDIAIQTTKHNQISTAHIALHMTFFTNDNAAFDVQIALNFTINFDGVFRADVAFDAATFADKRTDVGIADIKSAAFLLLNMVFGLLRCKG